MALPWVVELKKVLNDNEMGINQKAAKALAGLQQAGLAYTTVLKPKRGLDTSFQSRRTDVQPL